MILILTFHRFLSIRKHWTDQTGQWLGSLAIGNERNEGIYPILESSFLDFPHIDPDSIHRQELCDQLQLEKRDGYYV
jgi:hypothetical protein